MRFLTVILLSILSFSGVAAPVKVEGVRMWQAPDNLRLVFDISAPVEHSLFLLSNPERVVIDLRGAVSTTRLDALNVSDSWLKGLRSAARNRSDLRVVLDTSQRVRPKSFILKPNAQYGHRLVIDLEGATSPSSIVSSSKAPTKTVPKVIEKNGPGRDIIIAIDAGHGGEDPGALGRRGTREKDVVLQIARRLERLVKQETGMRPVMIRNGDYYVSLRERVRRARNAKADLFVSIHADSYRNANAHGSSVFALSQRGASSEAARLLAEKENAADLIGGVSLDDKDDLLASVLLDLSQSASIEASLDVGSNVLSHMKHVNRLHKSRVEQAGFAVLKSPDIPSILVETAFISNPTEERKLRNSSHQQQMANAIMKGVRNYFRKNPPPGTFLAQRSEREHVIRRGETLSSIARRYQVSAKTLRDNNDLRNDMLKAGDVLRIPTVAGG